MIQRKIDISVKIAKWLLAILLFWSVVLPYGLSLIFQREYHSRKIYIPATGETLYLISYCLFFSELGNRIELSKCGWRIYTDKEREFSWPGWESSVPYSDISIVFYYKVSNDTLYLSVDKTVETPHHWKSKVKIVQIENHDFATPNGIHGNQALRQQKEKWKELGFTAFP